MFGILAGFLLLMALVVIVYISVSKYFYKIGDTIEHKTKHFRQDTVINGETEGETKSDLQK